MTKEILNHRLISERYFFPRQGAFADPFWVECGDARLACSYHELDPQAKTLVHFHGNGEIVDDWQGDFVTLVQQLGCNVFLAELRGYGQSSGAPQLGKMLDDVVPTIEALGRPASELILFGRSVGSIFAIEAAERYPEVAGMVIESGVADVLERLLLRVHPQELGCTAEELVAAVSESLNHQQKMAAYPGPLLVMHTQYDGLVDVSHGQRLYESIGTSKKRWVFSGAKHNTWPVQPDQLWWQEVMEFVSQGQRP